LKTDDLIVEQFLRKRSGLNRLKWKKNIAIAATFGSLLVPMALDRLGCNNCDFTDSVIRSSPPVVDSNSVGRFCMIWSWMWPGAAIAWIITQGLLEKQTPIPDDFRNVSRLLAGMGGIGLLSFSIWLGTQQFTNLPYGVLEGWESGLAWLVLFIGFALWS
jgi:hypothetical protein